MNTVILDDEKWILMEVKSLCEEDKDINVVGTFTNPLELLKFCEDRKDIELAILDIEMPIISGLDVGEKLKKINSDINLIYATGYDTHAFEAYKIHAIAYLLKPYDKKEFGYAIDLAKRLCIRRNVFIRTFGRFDVFVDNKLVVFKRAKAKELLALLVDRQGGIVSMQYAIDKLWPERAYDETTKQMYRDAISRLRQTLKDCGCKNLVKFERGASYIELDKFDCDFYRLLSKDREAISEYNGEYMFDYDWSEHTQAVIECKLIDLKKS